MSMNTPSSVELSGTTKGRGRLVAMLKETSTMSKILRGKGYCTCEKVTHNKFKTSLKGNLNDIEDKLIYYPIQWI